MSQAKPLNVAVVGLGMGAGHARAFQASPRAKLVAVCDSDQRKLNWAAREFEFDRSYLRFEDLLADPQVQAISVCVPTWQHAELTLAALRAGRHVLCEKPMALNAAEAQAMHDAAQQARRVLMISQNQRFGADAQLLQRQIEAGVFGDLYHIRTGWRRPMGAMPGPIALGPDGEICDRNWFNERAKGGGVLRDLGSHLLDLALYLTGFPRCVEASCSMYRKFFPDEYAGVDYVCDSEDFAVGHLKFAGGLSLELEVSFASFIEQEVVFTELYGTRAGASRRNDLRFFHERDGAYTTEVVREFTLPTTSPQEEFVAAVLEQREPLVTSAQGVEVIRVLDMLYASAGAAG